LQVLEHFYLKTVIPIKVFGIDLSITNLTLSMFGAALLFFILFLVLTLRARRVPKKGQIIIEILVNFIKRYMIYNVMSKEEGDRWFPLIGGIFIFILSNNLIGIIPGAYTPTSNPMVPLTIAVLVFFIVQISNITRNGIKGYLRTFAPASVPSWMYVIVTPIEVISSIAKPFSMFIRLTANMLAGHTIIYVLLGLIIYFKNYFIATASVPFAVVMTIFEIFISAIQAYIFAVLSAIYIGEAVSHGE
jgi:F-type H+-transporting ATPase subunit a